MRRHRSEYPPAMQEVGDALGLFDRDGYLVPCPVPGVTVPGLAGGPQCEICRREPSPTVVDNCDLRACPWTPD